MAYIKDLFFDNLFLKLISLFFAATLWFYVTPIAPKDTLEVNYVLPLELKNIPPNMMTVGKIEERIGVRLKGGQGVIRDINPDKLSVNLDLSNASEGVRFYNLDPGNINVPSSIDVIRIEPRTIKIDMVKLKRKDVDVKVTLTGNPASGYRVKRISVNPPVITIEGPEAEVKDISSLEGLTINVTERKNSFSREVKIGTPQRNVRIIGKDVVIVDVEVDKS